MEDQEQWYHPKVEMGWGKDMAVEERRRNALRAHKGNKLSAARALLALANVTKDAETEREARRDADHFFALNEKSNRAKTRPSRHQSEGGGRHKGRFVGGSLVTPSGRRIKIHRGSVID